MASAFEISFLWTLVKDSFEHVTGKAEKKEANIIEAHRALNHAFIQTYNYLRNQQGIYVPKPELAEVWNDAAAAMMKVNMPLGEMLYHKSRFWLDPDLYINLGRAGDIIELNRLMDEMERLRLQLK